MIIPDNAINPAFKYSEITGRIIRCAMNVHSELGPGFREFIYQKALAIDLDEEGLAHEREFEMDVFYKGYHVGKQRIDFRASAR